MASRGSLIAFSSPFLNFQGVIQKKCHSLKGVTWYDLLVVAMAQCVNHENEACAVHSAA